MSLDKNKIDVFLTGGDQEGWALDTDLRLAKEALVHAPRVNWVTAISRAKVLHTVCPETLLEDRRYQNVHQNMPVVAVYSNDPIALFERVPGLYEASKKWFCVAQSRDAEKKLRSLNLPYVAYNAYVADFSVKPSPALDFPVCMPDLSQKYVVGSFQRDSLGSDLSSIKAQKGPDVLLAILIGLKKKIGSKLHVLLAGPRRHWLRKKLDEHHIEYTFVGKKVEAEDYPKNILSAQEIAGLMKMIDVYVVSSRWEGGPRAILEGCVFETKMISTKVGLASDLLNEKCLYENISEAIHLLHKDSQTDYLSQFVSEHFEKVKKSCSSETIGQVWDQLYSEPILDYISKFNPQTNSLPRKQFRQTHDPASNAIYRKFDSIVSGLYGLKNKTFSRLSIKSKKKITIWGEMIEGPYGGGSQVLKAIAGELNRRGFDVLNNSFEQVDAHILNSTFFDVSKAREVLRRSPQAKVVHRIDGPISLYRGKDRYLDEEICRFNHEVATSTALQSYYTFRESLRLGFDFVNPTIIRNACDPNFFFFNKDKLVKKNKIRIVSSSWSTNRIKGFDDYAYLDRHLDFNRFEYYFVGRSPLKFKNIEMIDAVESKKLGDILRSADLFITASQHDPASNALLEAINCGLPHIYLKSGGHAEFSWYSGLGYEKIDQVPALIEMLLDDIESYQACIYSLDIAQIVDSYLKLLF